MGRFVPGMGGLRPPQGHGGVLFILDSPCTLEIIVDEFQPAVGRLLTKFEERTFVKGLQIKGD
jgi:hypothetical protein